MVEEEEHAKHMQSALTEPDRMRVRKEMEDAQAAEGLIIGNKSQR